MCHRTTPIHNLGNRFRQTVYLLAGEMRDATQIDTDTHQIHKVTWLIEKTNMRRCPTPKIIRFYAVPALEYGRGTPARWWWWWQINKARSYTNTYIHISSIGRRRWQRERDDWMCARQNWIIMYWRNWFALLFYARMQNALWLSLVLAFAAVNQYMLNVMLQPMLFLHFRPESDGEKHRFKFFVFFLFLFFFCSSFLSLYHCWRSKKYQHRIDRQCHIQMCKH